jgi:hypothetical protein
MGEERKKPNSEASASTTWDGGSWVLQQPRHKGPRHTVTVAIPFQVVLQLSLPLPSILNAKEKLHLND